MRVSTEIAAVKTGIEGLYHRAGRAGWASYVILSYCCNDLDGWGCKITDVQKPEFHVESHVLQSLSYILHRKHAAILRACDKLQGNGWIMATSHRNFSRQLIHIRQVGGNGLREPGLLVGTHAHGA